MTIRNSITIEEAISVLNRALAADRDAVEKLRDFHVRCNQELAWDPEIQVRVRSVEPSHMVGGDVRKGSIGSPVFSVGLMGIINGLFGIDERTGYGAIAACYDKGCGNGCAIEADQLIDDEFCPICGSKLLDRVLSKFVAVDHSELPSLEGVEDDG